MSMVDHLSTRAACAHRVRIVHLHSDISRSPWQSASAFGWAMRAREGGSSGAVDVVVVGICQFKEQEVQE